jgi:hypothetical protein
MKKIVVLTMLSLTVFLSACNSAGTNPPPSNGANTPSEESQAVAEALVSELDISADGMTMTGLSLSNLTLSNLSSANSELSAQGKLNCVTATGDVSDPDGDGVPTAATYTYACNNIKYFGVTANITGVATMSDPSTDPNVKGFDSEVKDLRLELTNAYKGRSFTEKRNGTRNPRKTPTGLTFQHDLTILRDYQGAYGVDRTVLIGNKLNWVFTPAEGTTIAFDQPLPSGTVNASGTFSFDRDKFDKSFDVTTTPLQYDASCEQLPRYTAGVLQAEKNSSANGESVITIMYTGCGVKPTVEVTPAQ